MKQYALTFVIVIIAVAVFTYVVAPQIDKAIAGTAPAPAPEA